MIGAERRVWHGSAPKATFLLPFPLIFSRKTNSWELTTEYTHPTPPPHPHSPIQRIDYGYEDRKKVGELRGDIGAIR